MQSCGSLESLNLDLRNTISPQCTICPRSLDHFSLAILNWTTLFGHTVCKAVSLGRFVPLSRWFVYTFFPILCIMRYSITFFAKNVFFSFIIRSVIQMSLLILFSEYPMLLKLDGNPEIGALVKNCFFPMLMF